MLDELSKRKSKQLVLKHQFPGKCIKNHFISTNTVEKFRQYCALEKIWQRHRVGVTLYNGGKREVLQPLQKSNWPYLVNLEIHIYIKSEISANKSKETCINMFTITLFVMMENRNNLNNIVCSQDGFNQKFKIIS